MYQHRVSSSVRAIGALTLLVATFAIPLSSTAGAAVNHNAVGVVSIQPHTVALNCPSPGPDPDGNPIPGDSRTTADASVRPGVITSQRPPSVSVGTPGSVFDLPPLEYQAQGQGNNPWDGPQEIGPETLNGTLDHLVSVWQNSTGCDGSANGSQRLAWVADSSGVVFGQPSVPSDYPLQDPPPANWFGDMNGKHLNLPMVGMSPTSDGQGYWLVAADGGIFSFGDAQFRGSTGNMILNKPVTGVAVTPNGQGYWLVASDGGIFSFGDAPFYGSTGNLKLNRPVEAILPTVDGHGYWMVADDGGIFSFGDAQFHGSTGGMTLSAPIVGMIPNGAGYTLIGQDYKTYSCVDGCVAQ
jgi:hypothetical protein